MSKQLSTSELKNLTPEEIVDILNKGGKIVDATLPFIKDIFGKLKELVTSIQSDALSTPKGKRLAIEELQHQVEILNAKDAVQKELNKLNDQKIADLEATVASYKAKFVILGV